MHEINALLHEIGAKGRFHREFLWNDRVVGVEEWLVDTFSDCYPRDMKSIGSSPASSRVRWSEQKCKYSFKFFFIYYQ